MRILAISGSLRAASSNSVLIRAAAHLAPAGAEVEVYDGLADLPHFNPDLDVEPAPQAVAAFRARLAASDAILICSPEYAHGVPGSLKNALDWIVSSGELVDKPAGLINASSRATVARASLADTVTMLSAVVIEAASPVIALNGLSLDDAGLAADPAMGGALAAALRALAEAVSAK
jgi:NAD(P)H-dependent FMN reductase